MMWLTMVMLIAQPPPHQPDHRRDGAANANILACSQWISVLQNTAFELSQDGQIPIFLGGDHLMAAGTVSGISRRAALEGREQFVLWLDAHTDFHTIATTKSGNLHGTPVAYFIGRDGFGRVIPKSCGPGEAREYMHARDPLGCRSG